MKTSQSDKQPKRRKGESAPAFMDRLSNWKIEQAFRRKANQMRGCGHSRNKLWRIAQSERNLTLTEERNW